jgi:hypothetical protein
MSNIPEKDKNKPTRPAFESQQQSTSSTEGAHSTFSDNLAEAQKRSTPSTEGAHTTFPDKSAEAQKPLTPSTEGAHTTFPDKPTEAQKRSTSSTEAARTTTPEERTEAQKQSTSSPECADTTLPANPVTTEPAFINRSQLRTTLDRFRVRSHLRFKQWRETWVPLINVVVAVLAFIVITLQGRIYNEQKDIMNKQSEFMDQQTRLMEKSFRVSERAYVGVASVTANLETREILVMLQNIGHVPAAAVKLKGQHIRATAKEKDPKGVVFRWDAGAVELFPGTLMPVVVSLEDIEQSELDAISSKTKILYIAGTVEYDDGFKNPEKTTFAFQYVPPPQNRWIAHSDLSNVFKNIAR